MKKLREYFSFLNRYCVYDAHVTSADKVIPRQLFEVPIQAAVGKRIIARETLSAMRADVTAGLYGGTLIPRAMDMKLTRG